MNSKRKKIAKPQSEFFSSLLCIIGPSLPYGLLYSAIAKSPDGRSVFLFGGAKSNIDVVFENRILELHAGAYSWNWSILNFTLKNRRKNHVIIPLQ